MTERHPITPPPELVQQWSIEAEKNHQPTVAYSLVTALATRAAQWGADQELEACCEWLEQNVGRWEIPLELRDARRPKPPRLKEQALAIISTILVRLASIAARRTPTRPPSRPACAHPLHQTHHSTMTTDEANKALVQPELQGPKPAPDYGRVPEIATEAQIRSAAQYLVKKQGCDGDLVPAIRYAIARWGAPAIEPVPVSERPWERDGWCDAEGRCWWFCPSSMLPNGMCSYWCLAPADSPRSWFTHSLPHHALPVPGAEAGQ